MPKKPNACLTCKHDIEMGLCRHTRCKDCAMNLEEPVKTEEHGLTQCKCVTVKDGEECPYYEQVI